MMPYRVCRQHECTSPWQYKENVLTVTVNLALGLSLNRDDRLEVPPHVQYLCQARKPISGLEKQR